MRLYAPHAPETKNNTLSFPTDGEMDHSSKFHVKPIHSLPWLTDATDPGLISNKMRSIEAVDNTNHFPHENSSHFLPVSWMYRGLPFQCGSAKTSTSVEGAVPYLGTGIMAVDYFENKHPPDFSMAHEVRRPSPFADSDRFNGDSSGSLDQSVKKEGTFILMGHVYNKEDGSFIPLSKLYGKEGGNARPMSSASSKVEDACVTSICMTSETGDSDPPCMNSNRVSTVDFHLSTNTYSSRNIIGTLDFFTSLPLAQPSEVTGGRDAVELNASLTLTSDLKNAFASDSLSKKAKASKKASLNKFPSNVRSLLSTGIFDGIAVKYVPWSRDERQLRGVIKGTQFVCSCGGCNNRQAVSAYNFERHAGCKTKHPNDHIHFANGKSIYEVVLELKNTPAERLFETIRIISGSPINEKNFTIWKESYKAANYELQHSYAQES